VGSWRVGVLALLVVVGGLACAGGMVWALLPVFVALLLTVLAAFWSWWCGRHLQLLREAGEEAAVVGQELVQRFTLENDCWLPVGSLEVQDRSELGDAGVERSLSLGPHQTVSWETSTRLRRRGRYQLGPTELRVRDPLGLLQRRLTLPGGGHLVVYPALVAVPDPGQDDAPAPPGGARVPIALGWSPGPAAAPRRRSTDRRPQGGELLLLVDLESRSHWRRGSDSSLELAISLAASLAHTASRQGRAVALSAWGRELKRIPAARGKLHQRALLDYLATAGADGAVPFAELVRRELASWRDRGRVVLITPNQGSEWVAAVATASRPGNRALGILIDSSELSGQTPSGVPAERRLVLDLWVVRRGDDLARLDTLAGRAVV
jgi:uncharacterized protein (DUF58 family)